jgi:hypothetical protein
MTSRGHRHPIVWSMESGESWRSRSTTGTPGAGEGPWRFAKFTNT